MDDDYRDLTSQLFATATAMLEDAIEAAVAGQSSLIPPSQLTVHTRRLQGVTRDIATIAEAAAIIAKFGSKRPRKPRKSAL